MNRRQFLKSLSTLFVIPFFKDCGKGDFVIENNDTEWIVSSDAGYKNEQANVNIWYVMDESNSNQVDTGSMNRQFVKFKLETPRDMFMISDNIDIIYEDKNNA